MVKEVRKKLNSEVDIVRVENGAYRPFKDTLSSFLVHIVSFLVLTLNTELLIKLHCQYGCIIVIL